MLNGCPHVDPQTTTTTTATFTTSADSGHIPGANILLDGGHTGHSAFTSVSSGFHEVTTNEAKGTFLPLSALAGSYGQGDQCPVVAPCPPPGSYLVDGQLR